MAVRPRQGVDYQLGGLDPWKQFRPAQPMRRPVQERRRAWNDVPAAELRHSSGKEGAKLTADRLYPAKPKPTVAQQQLRENLRGAGSPLGTGFAKSAKGPQEAWARQAQRIRAREE
jgi:hypothetical protein